MNLQETGALVALMACYWPNFRPPEGMIEAWAASLADIGLDQAVVALRSCAEEDESGFAPSLGQFLGQFRTDPQGAAYRAWDRALEIVRRLGQHRLMREGYAIQVAEREPDVAQAVAAVGGWEVLCDQTADTRIPNRARFIESYRLAAEAAERGERMERIRSEIEASGGFRAIIGTIGQLPEATR